MMTQPDVAAGTPVVQWHLNQVVRPGSYPDYNFALVVLNQPIDNEPLFSELWARAAQKVAADGGANRVLQLHKRKLRDQTSSAGATQSPYTGLDVIIGDLDSLSNEARDFFSSPQQSQGGSRKCNIIHDPDQYSTDFTKAVKHIRGQISSSTTASSSNTSHLQSSSPPPDIICMGGLGGRVDQGLSQLHHLYLFQQDRNSYETDGRVFLLSGEGLTFLLQGGQTHRIHVREPTQGTPSARDTASSSAFAKHIGILPIKEPSVISTKGLEWDVTDWRTEFGGQLSTSNHVVEDVVEVYTTKDVLFTIALKRERGYDEVV